MNVTANYAQPSFQAKLKDDNFKQHQVLDRDARTQAKYYNAKYNLANVAPNDVVEIRETKYQDKKDPAITRYSYSIVNEQKPERNIPIKNNGKFLKNVVKTLEKLANPKSDEYKLIFEGKKKEKFYIDITDHFPNEASYDNSGDAGLSNWYHNPLNPASPFHMG